MKMKVTISQQLLLNIYKTRSNIRHQSGAGPHGSKKYARHKKKREDYKEIRNF